MNEEALAGDLSQDVWVDAVRQRPDLEGQRLRGWLSTVARRRASKLRRRRRSAQDAEATWLGNRAAPDSEDLAEDRLVLHRQLMDVIDALDEPDREAIVAYFLEGLNTAELARRTGVPEGTLRQRRRRALGRLRQRLNDDDPRWSRWLPAIALVSGDRWSAPKAVLATSPLPITSLTLMWKFALALSLVLLTSAAWWIGLPLTEEPSPPRPIARAEAVAREVLPPSAANDAEVLMLPNATRDRTVLQEIDRPALAPTDHLRVVDDRGDPVPDVAGVWIDSERELAPLEFDNSGRAPRPTAMGGLVVLAAPGFLDAETSVAAPDGTPETRLTLRRARTLNVQLMLGDEPLARATRFHDETTAPRHPIAGTGLGLGSTEAFWGPLQSARAPKHLVSSKEGRLRIIESSAPGPMRIQLPDWLLGSSVTAPMELEEGTSVVVVPKACFESQTGADWQLTLTEEARVARGRFVWQDDKTPLRGHFTIHRHPPCFSRSTYRGNIAPDGTFQFCAANRAGGSDEPNPLVARGEFYLFLEDEATGTYVGTTVSMASVPEDGHLGTIEIPRPRELQVQVIEFDAAGVSIPVRAAVVTERSRECTGPDGMATVTVDSKEAIWIQGEAHAPVLIPRSHLAAAEQSEPLVVEVRRSPCLSIEFAADTSTCGTEILLECDGPLFAQARRLDDVSAGPFQLEPSLWSRHRALGTELGRVSGRMRRAWILPNGTSPIRVSGLTQEAPITVSWVDELFQTIASTVVTLDGDRRVHLGGEKTARLTVRAVLRGTKTPIDATVEIEERGAKGQLVRPLIAGYTTFATLLPGAYQITVRASVGGAEISSTTTFELDESEEEALFEF